MSVWYRIFGQEQNQQLKQLILEEIQRFGNGLQIDFANDLEGHPEEWQSFTITHGKGSPLVMERYLASEEGIRGELNTWAGLLETCDYNPNYVPLMEQMIQTQELFTLRRPIDVSDEILVGDLCDTLCRVISRATRGVYQIDHVGFHDPEGKMLLQEY